MTGFDRFNCEAILHAAVVKFNHITLTVCASYLIKFKSTCFILFMKRWSTSDRNSVKS